MCRKLVWTVVIAVSVFASMNMNAQQLNLEGQTGGFITPTAYVVLSEKGQPFSHPAVGYHFINASAVIGNIQTVSITEGFANRAEIGYTRSIHSKGNNVALSGLWDYSGMNVFHAKAVLLKDGTAWFLPGVAVGGVMRTDDKFVSGRIDQILHGSASAKAYTNGDVYIVATKTWLKPPVPLLLNLGWKATNASIFGIGGQSTRFEGRFFGGLGIPLPGPWKTAIVPSAGFAQEPPQVENLGALLYPGTRAHIPTTLDYAVRITQKEHAHFALDLGVGQVAGQIGVTPVLIGGVPVAAPVNLQARHVFGMGISIRP